MNIDVDTLIQVYKEEIKKLQDENIVLKCKLVQIEKNRIKDVQEQGSEANE